MTFTFECLDENYKTQRGVVTQKESLAELLEEFEQFLRGCGFVFEGHLDIVDND